MLPTYTYINSDEPGVTYKVASTDAAAGIAAGKLLLNNMGVEGVLVSIEDNPIRLAIGVDPTQAGLGHEYFSGDKIFIGGRSAITNMKWISSGAGNAANIQITLFYRK